ncbi:hypothetical protein M0802_016897, partial [Mischocyttarus mexicanus]
RLIVTFRVLLFFGKLDPSFSPISYLWSWIWVSGMVNLWWHYCQRKIHGVKFNSSVQMNQMQQPI